MIEAVESITESTAVTVRAIFSTKVPICLIAVSVDFSVSSSNVPLEVDVEWWLPEAVSVPRAAV